MSGIPTEISVSLESQHWLETSGTPVDRTKLMVVLNNLEGVFIRGSYSDKTDGYARLSDVNLGNSYEVKQVWGEIATSVEICECHEAYYGNSCEECAIGYWASGKDQWGPICKKCNCNNHAGTCHPRTGE